MVASNCGGVNEDTLDCNDCVQSLYFDGDDAYEIIMRMVITAFLPYPSSVLVCCLFSLGTYFAAANVLN